MKSRKVRSEGFVLIAALLLLFLLSGLAVGIMMLTTSEIRIGGNDRETNIAYYGAESGMEKLTADLAALYDSKQSPSPTDIQALTNTPPNSAMVGQMTYGETITYPTDANGNPATRFQLISSGTNEGLNAIIVPMTLQVTSLRPSGASANITRGVEVALIPVFQFGVFSDSDLSYFNGPPFQFAGRVHTNGNLFPTPGGNLIFGAKITAAGQIIRDRLANGYSSSPSYIASVYAPNASGGCDSAIATAMAGGAPALPQSNCLSFDIANASWTGGIPAAGAANTTTWPTTSTVNFNGYIGNSATTGVKKLILPFVQGGGTQNDIVRKPPVGESATSALGASRIYNQANMRILLADTLADLHPERGVAALDANDVDLGAAATAGTTFGGAGVPAAVPTAVAYAKPGVDASWQAPTSVGAANANFPLISGYLRVEIKNVNTNTWQGVTNQWLALGFARSPVPAPAGTGINPNAILRLQELADTNGDEVPDRVAMGTNTSFYPINFYDPREGQVRDAANATASTCTVNGIMNAVELDAGNLKAWLANDPTGKLVTFSDTNGYLLYFSDRRGMLTDINLPTPTKNGSYGFEDVINGATSAVGTPDGILDQGEDLDNNSKDDTWGATNVGDGFRKVTAGNPYATVDCMAQGRMNKVTGARHVLRLIDGKRGNIPLPPGSTGNNGGGFSVGSENPVYIWGDYNSSLADGAFVDDQHAAAAVLADAVTLLSNGWDDERVMKNTTNVNNRPATETYYRLAIAAGKNINFSNPSAANAKDWGTDGGVHNFLRYLENWSGVKLHYNGSLVSLYYSQYATGTFKCCNTVYGAPNRAYQFDTLFLNPTNLPPGTPMFQDIVNLSYRQDFTPY